MKSIYNAVSLGKRIKHVYVATADSRGLPHLAAAGAISVASEGRVAVEAWFCPQTVENVQNNPLASVVAWDPETDTGYQILGEVENMEEEAMLNGFSPKIEKERPLPQALRKLTIRVNEVLEFSHAPHSDEPERAPL